jgi:hypothetical protein
MLPLNMGGFMLSTGLVVTFLQGIIFDDPFFIAMNTIILMSIEWLLSLGAGIWAIMTLMNEDVIAGFEYVAD